MEQGQEQYYVKKPLPPGRRRPKRGSKGTSEDEVSSEVKEHVESPLFDEKPAAVETLFPLPDTEESPLFGTYPSPSLESPKEIKLPPSEHQNEPLYSPYEHEDEPVTCPVDKNPVEAVELDLDAVSYDPIAYPSVPVPLDSPLAENIAELKSNEPSIEEKPTLERRRSSMLELDAVSYHPIHLLEPQESIPEIPETVEAVGGEKASSLLRTIMKIVKILVKKDKNAADYFTYLRTEFGPKLALIMVPCVLQLQTDALKSKRLLAAARQYRLKLWETEERVPRLNRTSQVSTSSLLSPSVARERQAAREQTQTHSHRSVGSIPFMVGQLNVTITGSQEMLDEDSGKFYTVYHIQCTWTVPGTENSEEKWIVSRRYREFQAMDILIRESHPQLLATFPPLPGKRYVGSSLSADFVDKRQSGLTLYIESLVFNYPNLVEDGTVDAFLELKRNVMQRTRRKMQRQAVRHGPGRLVIEEMLRQLGQAKVMSDSTSGNIRPYDAESFLLVEQSVQSLADLVQSLNSDNVVPNLTLEALSDECLGALPRIRVTARVSSRLQPLAVECERILINAISVYENLLQEYL